MRLQWGHDVAGMDQLRWQLRWIRRVLVGALRTVDELCDGCHIMRSVRVPLEGTETWAERVRMSVNEHSWSVSPRGVTLGHVKCDTMSPRTVRTETSDVSNEGSMSVTWIPRVT